MNNEWITDRKPTRDDGITVYDRNGSVCQFFCIAMGDPWKPIPQIEPYVKPKRYEVKAGIEEMFYVRDVQFNFIVIKYLNTYEAADEIATVLERVKPWKG